MRSQSPSLAPSRHANDVTVHIVLDDFGSLGRAYVETDEADADMATKVKFWSTLVALLCIVVGPMTDRASAITVEIAKKCDGLTAKAFPPRQVGNPAAGSAKGSGKDVQDYYRKCVANGGNMDERAK